MGAAAGSIIPQIAGTISSQIGGVLGGAGAGSGTYAQFPIGSASDVTNVNPMTGNAWNQFMQNLGQYSPTQNVGNLQGVTPGIQDIAGQLIRPYGASQMDLAQILGGQAQRNVANQYANSNALNSGSALSAMARGWAEPAAQAATNVAGMQSQLGGGLANSVMGQMGNAYQSGMQGITQFGTPEWWAPSYQATYQPGPLEILGSFFSLGGGASGGLSSGSMAAPSMR